MQFSIQEQTTRHECEAVSRRARLSGAWTCVSLNSRLGSNKEEEGYGTFLRAGASLVPSPVTCISVWGLGSGGWGLRFEVWVRGLVFGVRGLGFGVWGLGFWVEGLGSRVWGLGRGVWSFGFGV